MPNDVVDAVHRLAAASKQARGTTFTDRDGKILPDDDEDEAEEDEPIPVAHDVPIMEETDNMNDEINDEQQENDTITGVHENKQNDDDTSEHNPENTHDNIQTTPEEEKNRMNT